MLSDIQDQPISIRSGKHASSTAYTHALDFNRVLELTQLYPITRFFADKSVKPVFIFTVDGGSDENLWY